jgi:hypothetical protein
MRLQGQIGLERLLSAFDLKKSGIPEVTCPANTFRGTNEFAVCRSTSSLARLAQPNNTKLSISATCKPRQKLFRLYGGHSGIQSPLFDSQP